MESIGGAYSPTQMIERYKYLYEHPEQRAGNIRSQEDALNFQAYQSFAETVGRGPNANEYAQVMPLFHGPDGINTGRSYLAQFAEAEKRSPEALRRQAPQKHGDVDRVFQDLLKRGASQDELNHFGSLLASGEVDPFELRSFVQQLPEYRTAEDSKFRQGLSGELESYDRDFFNKTKEDVLSSYASAGIQHSSALDSALTQLMGDISKERSKYLAGISAEQYGGNKNLAREDYGNVLDRYASDRNYGRGRSDSALDALTARSWAGRDYERQRGDYMNFLNSQNKSSPFHTRDWVNLGLKMGNSGFQAAAQAYGMGNTRAGQGQQFDYFNA